MRHFVFIFFLLIGLISCKEQKVENKTDEAALTNCKRQVSRLQNQLLDAHVSAGRLEELVYRLTQSYIIIDEKLRLIQQYQKDPTKKAFLNRTASEVNLFFAQANALIDSSEADVKRSPLSKNTLLPIITSIRSYLNHQEKLFLDVYGSLGVIQNQVSKLEQKVKAKEKEINAREKDTRQQLDIKEREKRNIHYLVGNKSELNRSKAVKKSGGILGVGGSLKLSDYLDDNFFQSGDYVVLKEISLGNTKKVNLITTHPKGTYIVVETPGEKFLKVTNPEKFWSASKYLVVEVD